MELRVTNPYAALSLMDSVIQHPLTKNDFYTWTSRAYIYYELYKKTDKLKLYSSLRDSILSSVRRSNQLKPDSGCIENNKRMLKALANGYLNIAKKQLEDSFNIKNTYAAFNKFKELKLKVDTAYSILFKECELRTAIISTAVDRYSKKWGDNKTVDTTELIFVNNEINSLHKIYLTIPDPIVKELPLTDKNFLKEEEKTVDKKMLSQTLKLNQALIYNNYNSVLKNKYQNEALQKQIQLALSNQENQLAQLKAQKQKDEIELLNSKMAISQFLVDRQKKDNELLQNEKQLQQALVEKQKKGNEILLYEKKLQQTLIEKQKIESKEKEEELRQQRFVRNISLAGILLLFMIIFLIYRNLALNKKQNKIILEQKAEVENQNQIISKQKHLVEEKHKEITDSINYAERIQRSFLASKELLDENLNRVRSSSEAFPIAIGREATYEDSSRYVPQEAGGTTRTDSQYFVFFQPKDVVSGDFYWASSCQCLDERVRAADNKTDDEQGSAQKKLFYLCTADSTGHGVPGAIMSLLNIASLEKAIEHHASPAEILNHTRQTIIERLKKDGSKDGGKDGMDCSLIAFDFKNLKMTYAAANNPVWIVRKKPAPEIIDTTKNNVTSSAVEKNEEGLDFARPDTLELIELNPDRMPVGKHDKDKTAFTEHEVELKTNDVVYTLTDGMPDQFGGERGKKFMYKQLKEFLISISQLPMQEQKTKIENTLKAWMGDNEQVDDVCIIGVRI